MPERCAQRHLHDSAVSAFSVSPDEARKLLLAIPRNVLFLPNHLLVIEKGHLQDSNELAGRYCSGKNHKIGLCLVGM